MSSPKVRPFLMFEGKAEEAMNFYVSLFASAKIMHIDRYGPQGPGKQGSVRIATFSIADQEVICTDSFVKHNFTFTPAFSLLVECESEERIDRLSESLSAAGSTLMPLNNYGFSRKFAWVNDRFGVSWQLNLP